MKRIFKAIHIMSNTYSISNNVGVIGFRLFVFFFFFWNLFALLSIHSRRYFYKLNLFPYDFQYPKLNVALLNEIYFIFAVFVSFYLFKSKSKKIKYTIYNNFKDLNFTLLIISVLIFLVLIQKYGMILFAGNYLERFDVEIPVYFMYINTAFILIFFSNYLNGIYKLQTNRFFFLLVILFLFSSLLLGSRSYAFKVFLSILLIFFIKRKEGFKLINALHLVVFFSLVYFLGQMVNVFRWYAFDFNYQQVILQLNSDSFSELRSYADVIDRLGADYGKAHLGLNNLFLDFISRIFPSFIYDLLGLNRMDYYNSTWLYLDKIIFANSDGDFGIRVGLVGEIDLLLGRPFLFIIGGLYGYLFSIKRNQFFISIVLINSIAYGLSSTYILITTIVIWLIIRILSHILTKK